MIENYQEVMNEWGNPPVGCCTNMMTIDREEDLQRWAVTRTITVLANSDYYYTKTEVDDLLKNIHSGMTPEEVQAMINRSIASKADKAAVDALSVICSRPETTTMEPLVKYLLTNSPVCRQATQSMKSVSFSPVSLLGQSLSTATQKLATARPEPVRLSSGSRVRRPIIVI